MKSMFQREGGTLMHNIAVGAKESSGLHNPASLNIWAKWLRKPLVKE